MDTQHLKRLIAENKVEDVLEILLEQVQGQNDDFAKQIISISNRYHRYSDDILKGIEFSFNPFFCARATGLFLFLPIEKLNHQNDNEVT